MRKTFLFVFLVIIAVALGTLTAYADCFPTVGLGNLSANKAIVQSGRLGEIKSLSLNFENKLETILRAAGTGPKWIESIKSAMEKGAKSYNEATLSMSLGKDWNFASQEFLRRWNWGELQLSAETQDKINRLTQDHFKRLSAILADERCPGCMGNQTMSSGGAGPR